MSGIYIPDMSLPGEEDLWIVVRKDGSFTYNVREGWQDGKQKTVPVPPHGRLGDLDALAEYVHQQDDWLSETAIHAFCGILCKTPAIIPAEPLNEEVNE